MHHRFLPSAALLAASLALPALAAAQAEMVPVPKAPHFEKYSIQSEPLDLNTEVHVGFGLTGFNKVAADAFVASQLDPKSPNFHKWISTSDFGSRFGASSSDIQAVINYLSQMGFTDVHAGSGGTFISATGTLQLAQKAFSTTFANFGRPASMVSRGEPRFFYGPTAPIKIPRALANKVEGVFGLDNFAIAHPGFRKSALKTAVKKQGFQGYTGKQIALAYDSNGLESVVNGAHLKIAVYSPTARYINDPDAFATKTGIPKDYTIYDLLVDKGATTTTGAAEASLDIEVIIGQAPGATIFMVTPPSTLTGELDAYDSVGIVGDIPVLSSSWGIEESGLIGASLQSFGTAFENVCESLAASGVTLFNDAGDWAAYDAHGTGKITEQMETCCPYVTGVGGTALYTNSNGSYKGETLWQYTGSPTAPHGGGGGLSQLFKIPAWQTGYGVKNKYSNGFRETPDVSANSDPNTGYYVVIGGQVAQYGGTSAATPLWAANLLLMEEYWAKSVKAQVFLGLINPFLYELGNWFEDPQQDAPGTSFMWHDITLGNNGVYPTTVGYDLCAGWGSADFGATTFDLGYAEHIPGFVPDFEPYKPTSGGWTSPIMFHSSSTSLTEPTTFVHGTKYYVSICAANIGNSDGPLAAVAVAANSTYIIKSAFPALPSLTYYYYADQFSYTFPAAGTYKITYVVNYGSAVRESSTTNNTYTRTIVVH